MSVHRVAGHYVDIDDDELIPKDKRIIYLAGFGDGVRAERSLCGMNESFPVRASAPGHRATWDRYSSNPAMCAECSVPLFMTADGWMHVPEDG